MRKAIQRMKIKLITGLGNNQALYNKTRHNLGFKWIDQLAEKEGLNWKKHQHTQGYIAKWQHSSGTIYLFKPGLFMNTNGAPIASCARYHKITTPEILVVYDELDFPPGVIKLRENGSHGGHNGIKDIIQHTKENNFLKLRIGIGKPSTKSQTGNYVLQKPNEEDEKKINTCIDFSINNLHLLLEDKTNKYQQALASCNCSTTE